MSNTSSRRNSGGTRERSSGRNYDYHSSTQRSTARRSSRNTGRRSSEQQRIEAVQNARRNASRNSGQRSGRRGRRRQQPDLAKILLIGIGVIILILCIAVGIRSCSGKKENISETETMEIEETELHADIAVNGISINGLKKSEAKTKILEQMNWNLSVSYNGTSEPVFNIMEARVDAVLDEAYSGQGKGSYTVDAEKIEDAAKAEADRIAAVFDVKPQNGSLSGYDSATGKFTFAPEKNGVMIDREKLTSDIVAAATSENYGASIEATAHPVSPEITEAKFKESFGRIGTFTTTTTANKDRNENIRLASTALNGLIIQPGEEFSMNTATGQRTLDKGYKPAGAYLNGVLVEEPGGGVCQVSSTLYNAVVMSGLKTTERHAHSYEPSYVTPGEDAMISFGSADMKFVNNSDTAVGIKTSFSNQKLTISIYGMPILEPGISLSMRSEKVKEMEPLPPVFEEDPTLQPNEQKIVKQPVLGSRWVTYLVKKENGNVVDEIVLHNSNYAGKPAKILVNTSGTAMSEETESTAPSAVDPSAPVPPAESVPESSPSESSENMGPGFDPVPQPSASPVDGPDSMITPPEPAPGEQAVPGQAPGI